jgi:hypothetical protein
VDDHSLIYRVSPEGLHMMNYCNGVESFINYGLSNLKNISGSDIRYPCKIGKNKKFLDPDAVIMHLLQKKVHREILVLVCT